MTYTARTCTLSETITMKACLKAPFVPRPVYPLISPNYHSVLRNNSTGAFEGYASYIDNGTDQSFFSDFVDPDDGNFGAFYTGSKFMAVTKISAEYHVGYVAHAYADADDLTAASLTTANIGDGGVTPGSVNYNLCGPAEAGGDRISWLENQTTSVHFLTATTSALTRQQAFPIEAGESYSALSGFANGFMYDGEDYWYVTRLGTTGGSFTSGPFKCLLIRFKPTTVSDPYDYEKFELTFSDSTIMDIMAGTGTLTTPQSYGVSSRISGDQHWLSIFGGYDYDLQRPIGRTRWFLLNKEATSYTEYVIEGSQAVIDFAFNNVPAFTKNHDGTVRLIGWAFSTGSGGLTVGTYDLTCSGKQGHIHAKRRTLGPPIITTGNLIPSGDMQSGSDKFLTSGDMQDGTDKLLWQEIK